MDSGEYYIDIGTIGQFSNTVISYISIVLLNDDLAVSTTKVYFKNVLDNSSFKLALNEETEIPTLHMEYIGDDNKWVSLIPSAKIYQSSSI